MSQKIRIPSRILVFFLIVILFLLAIGAVAYAQTGGILSGMGGDGRINQVAHFGGDHIYCDSSSSVLVPPAMPGGVYFMVPGFFLLNSTGQVLWRVPGETVMQALSIAEPNGGPVLVANGWGTYGPTAIYVREATDAITHTYVVAYTFTGYDEWGHFNSLSFRNCDPVAAPEQPASPSVQVTPESTDEPIEEPTEEPIEEPTEEPTEEILMCVDEVRMIELPCDQCRGGSYWQDPADSVWKCAY